MAQVNTSNNKNSRKVAVVSGSNRGLGLQIVKNLSQQLDPSFEVLLTSRSEERGQEAVKQLIDGGKKTSAAVKFHQLDIDDHKSIENLRNDLQKTYGGLDILVQNAGIMMSESKATIGEIAEQTMKTNYWSARDLCYTVLPIMRENGRIVLMASRLGFIMNVKCLETRQRLLSDDLKIEEVDKLMQKYVDEAKARSSNNVQQPPESKIFNEIAFQQPHGPYCVSKVGVVALGHILQREADTMDGGKKKILVTSCCPGYVDTDMTAHKGEKTVEEGADTPTYLALLKEDGESGKLKGQFVAERQVIDWKNFKHRSYLNVV